MCYPVFTFFSEDGFWFLLTLTIFTCQAINMTEEITDALSPLTFGKETPISSIYNHLTQSIKAMERFPQTEISTLLILNKTNT